MNKEMVFPQPELNCDKSASKGTQRGGLTKRELFAAMAMQGLLSDNDTITIADMNASKEEMHTDIHISKVIANVAVVHADSLIAELEKTK